LRRTAALRRQVRRRGRFPRFPFPKSRPGSPLQSPATGNRGASGYPPNASARQRASDPGPAAGSHSRNNL
jgi:hypothetical protein